MLRRKGRTMSPPTAKSEILAILRVRGWSLKGNPPPFAAFAQARRRMAERCPSGRQCVRWVHKYLRDCVCGVRDELSIAFGLISMCSWAVAELPQIITNFKSHSTEGVSHGFLVSWLLGDIFNLVGCLFEPATLPTQLYTAVLYTIASLILVLQIIYYNHICKWLKARKMGSTMKEQPQHNSKEIDQNHNRSKSDMHGSPRSLTSGPTLTDGFRRSGPSSIVNQSSIKEEQGSSTDCLATTSSINTNNALVRTVVGSTFFIGGLNLHMRAYNIVTSSTHAELMERGLVIHLGRKLLQEVGGATLRRQLDEDDKSINILGTCLGWLMAATYMAGRLPQIYLNVKRGTIKGLNPLMFMFTVFGNVTYMASILIRTLKWEKIKGNMPWLVDAGTCLLLDLFIVIQFIYYKTKKDVKFVDNDEGNEESK